MIQLFLNEKEVFFLENTTIKLIKENPYFTKSGSSTMSISLPMSIEQNIIALGHINRIDYNHRPITFKAKITENYETLIIGEAVINEVTPEVVKIQILGGTSLMNFYNKMENIYIDEIYLGLWGGDYAGMLVNKGTTYTQFITIWYEFRRRISTYGMEAAQDYLHNILFGLDNEWVAFPIYNETSEVMCNDWIIREIKNTEGLTERYMLDTLYNIEDEEPNGFPQVRFAIQPYLLPMVKRIFRALGYSVDMSSIESNILFSKIFIANANEKPDINKSLPHWAVKDFINQIEYFLGVVFDVDEDKKHLRIVRRCDFFNIGSYEIKEVLDEFTISAEDDQESLFASNIGYSGIDSFAKLDTWILENAKRTYFSTYDDLCLKKLEMDGISMLESKFNEEYKDSIIEIESTGEQYICVEKTNIFKPSFLRVNYFCDRIVKENNKDVDIELKIIPVKIITEDYKEVYRYNEFLPIKESIENSLSAVGELNSMSMTDYGVRKWGEEMATENDYAITDVEAAINGEEGEDNNKEDLMRVAINSGAYTKFYNFFTGMYVEIPGAKYPKPIIYSPNGDISRKEFDYNMQETIDSMGLNISLGSPKISLATEVYDCEPAININEKYCIKFISKELLNPNYKFVIHNQEYVCEKLEYQLKSIGKEKIVTGYFYKLQR